MDKHIIVMAAGESTRWEADYPKQLAQVGEHTCISRIAAQLHYLEKDNTLPILVARDDAIREEWHRAAPFYDLFMPDPRHRFFIARGLLHTKDLWGAKRTTFLLGDTIYSNEAIETIVTATRMKYGDVRFWLGKGEIFAFTMTWRAYDVMCNIMRDVNEHASRQFGSTPVHTIGKIWDIYRLFNGFPMESKSTKLTPSACLIKDYTMDLDALKDYEKFKRDVLDAGLLEEPLERQPVP